MKGVPHDSPRGGIAAAQKAGGKGSAEEPRRTRYGQFAHDINNPLAIVLANLEFALAELGSQPEGGGEVVEALGEAREAVERIRDLVSRYVAEMSEASQAATMAPEPMPQSTPVVPVKARVLVVDDEPMLGRAISRGLRDHTVTAVTNGAEAMSLLRRGERFDVILCDLMMPDMPGFDLHEQVRLLAADQAERMVFMTGGATTTRAREFVESWRGKVLQKPVSMDTVRETVARMLAAAR